MTKNAYDNLSNTIEEPKVLSTQKEVIDHFLFHELPKAGYNIVFCQMILPLLPKK